MIDHRCVRGTLSVRYRLSDTWSSRGSCRRTPMRPHPRLPPPILAFCLPPSSWRLWSPLLFLFFRQEDSSSSPAHTHIYTLLFFLASSPSSSSGRPLILLLPSREMGRRECMNQGGTIVCGNAGRNASVAMEARGLFPSSVTFRGSSLRIPRIVSAGLEIRDGDFPRG